MSRNYEMMYILRPDLSEDQISAAVTKYQDLLTEYGATEITNDVWGRRRLAYPIQKFNDGIYVLVHYSGDGKQVAAVERMMRLSEDVLRFLSLKQEIPAVAEEAEPVAAEA
ncbi:30S ribosomal protein S6 [Spirulina major CS-329]|uniref:30S ribosomal protein S6 n=1 Tax=Spirulina TaxID=1154 RepID=UPI00232B5008|nr:30S ribosomal protein S6 [Spirulina subsalsa]MDB9493756.1 30S ribosomal protein S6 [Spirulina subsalsa CS-330]MDB9503572.1 30S ribosomal protein S6 [Spirulina major CS-329]